MSKSFSLTLPQATGPVFFLTDEVIAAGCMASRQSPRKRIMMQLHRSGGELVQRLLNFMQLGSYVRPHFHPRPENVENASVIKGSGGFIIFDAEGKVISAFHMRAGQAGGSLVDIEQGVWHTLIPLSEDTVILEIKRGPYCAETDKVFAPWAPAEGSPESEAYLRSLESLFE